MRSYPVISAIIALFLFITACSNLQEKSKIENTTASNKAETKKIMWLAQWYGEGKKETLVREIARDFMFQNQDCEVEIVFPHEMCKIKYGEDWFVPTTDSIIKWIKTDTWPYDLMLCDSYMYKRVVQETNYKDWGKYYLTNFENDEWYRKSHIESLFETDLFTSQYGGIAPGAFIEGIWNVLYLSEPTEKKLNLEVKKNDMSLADLTAYAKVVYEYNQNNSDKITFLRTPFSATIILFSHLTMSALGKDSATNNEEAFSALEEVYKGLEEIARYEPIKNNLAGEDDKDLFEHKVLFNYSPSWIKLIWESRNPSGEKEMHPCELPSIGNNKSPYYSGNYNAVFGIPKKAKNKEATIRLMKFIATEETADKWTKYSQCPTGMKHKVVYSDFSMDETNRFSLHLKNKYNNRMMEANLSKALFKTDKYINFPIDAVLNGEMSANKALELVKGQLGE